MNALKWLLNASLLIAFMLLGMEAKPQKEENDKTKPTKSVLIRLIG